MSKGCKASKLVGRLGGVGKMGCKLAAKVTGELGYDRYDRAR